MREAGPDLHRSDDEILHARVPRRARVRDERPANLGPRPVSANNKINGVRSLLLPELKQNSPILQLLRPAELGLPPDRLLRNPREQQPRQIMPRDLGAAAAAHARVPEVAVHVQHAGPLLALGRERQELVVQAAGADGGQAGLLVQVQHARHGSQVGLGGPRAQLEDGEGDAALVQQGAEG
jgi:hypothetical protein